MDLNSNSYFVLKCTILFLSTILFIKLLAKIRPKSRTKIRPKSRTKRSTLPPIAKTPLIKGIVALINGTEPMMIREMYEKLGSVFTLNYFTRKVTFLIEPEMVEYFFKAPDTVLSQREVYNLITLPIFGPDILFDADADEKQKQVRVFREAVRSSRFSGFVSLITAETEEYFSKWKDSGTIDLNVELRHLLLIVGSRCLLGKDSRDSLSMFGNIVSLIRDWENGITSLTYLSPYIPIPAHIRRDRARAKLVHILSKIIDDRISQMETCNEDVLQSFIDEYKGDTPKMKQKIIGLFMFIIFATHHTTSHTNSWIGVHLLHQPKFLVAAIEEQKETLRRHGHKLDVNILSQMDILYRCIKESLRLQPAAFAFFRYSRSDFTIRTKEGRELTIPKGQLVGVAPSLVNRLPFLYKEPDTYDPDRFSSGRSEEDKIGGPFANINFGGGRNACPGERFVYLTIQVIWTILLRKFELGLVYPLCMKELDSMYSTTPKKVLVRCKRRDLSATN